MRQDIGGKEAEDIAIDGTVPAESLSGTLLLTQWGMLKSSFKFDKAY
ncbi:hypothetical protein JS561_03040 [Salmonella enterica subsp. enterica serovar Infantis]|nr:hypothetical protein JS561_03040 [Salmonella enterica subsp. enterica serovar Infantis]